MGELNYQYDVLSTREGFNSSLRHFNLVMEMIEAVGKNSNLSDIINDFLFEKRIENEQIKPILNALLADKYKYYCSSYNLINNLDKFDNIVQEVMKWNAVDIVIAYYHPELGITTVNPKNIAHWETIQSLKRNELLTIYIGEFEDTSAKKIYQDAFDKLINLINGKTAKAPAAFTKGKCKPPVKNKPVVQQRTPKITKTNKTVTTEKEISPKKESTPVLSSKARMTPMYGITVTNELFHNGNVEAWKKVIASYELQHEGLKVFVFYDGEKINDINTLFKWGKVKRGTAIMISVAGENITDVAKLKRYLMQGASSRFEAFLKGPPNKILNLF